MHQHGKTGAVGSVSVTVQWHTTILVSRLIWNYLIKQILWHYSRRSLNRTWTSRQKKSALKEKNTGLDQTSNRNPLLQQPQRATGVLYMYLTLFHSLLFPFPFILRSILSCFSSLLWYSKELFYFQEVVSFLYRQLQFLHRDQGKPHQTYEEGQTKSECYTEDPRSVSQNAHGRGAHQRAWQNWCVIQLNSVYSCFPVSVGL